MRQLMPAGDVLILAGDITYFLNRNYSHPFFDKISEAFTHVYMIPGNHEFYGGRDIEILETPLKKNIRDNVYLVNNIVENIDGVDFFFTTLWSNITLVHSRIVKQRINDFRMINYKGKKFTTDDFNTLHNQSLFFLDSELEKSVAKKKVIVTHHCPTALATAKEFRGDKISEAFVVELHDFIFNNPIDYWIFGHTHRNEPAVSINGTIVLSNQLGYVLHSEHKKFKMDAFFEIDVS